MRDESSTPTCFIPTWSAWRASARAAARPLVAGTESSTIVQPRFPAGQTTSVLRGGGGGAGASPVVVGVVEVVVVGSGAVCVGVLVDGPACVRTSVSLAELERSASQRAETAPAPTATSSASRVGQIQSPGYQPSCRRQIDPRKATGPELAGSRWPHSRQYSWPSA